MNAKPFIGLLIAASLVALCVGAEHSPVHTPFSSALLRNFDAWDTNHDGTLSLNEINQAVLNPAIMGDDAAAAASIMLVERSKARPLAALTKEYFAEYEKRTLANRSATIAPADAVDNTIDSVETLSDAESAARHEKSAVDFDLYFAASKQRIARGGADRYPRRFVLDHTRQGPLGDCFFVASISSMMIHDPTRLEKFIEPVSTGGYIVRLPGTQPIAVPPLTDGERAISSTTTGDGDWLAIMEQAFGKYRSRIKGHSEDVEGTAVLRVGGDSAPTIAALTGHKTLRLSLGKTVEYRQERAQTMLPKIRAELQTALADHRLITAGMNPPPTKPNDKGELPPKLNGTPVPIPPDINVGHVYAVVSYDPAADVIEIWNPHGQHFAPKGPAGIDHGYPTEHGRFKLPLTEAYQFYTSFTFEQAN